MMLAKSGTGIEQNCDHHSFSSSFIFVARVEKMYKTAGVEVNQII